MKLSELLNDEALRVQEFPVAKDHIFMAHAAVCILPKRAAVAMQSYLEMCCVEHQESGDVWRHLTETRAVAAKLIGAKAQEIALIGPTSLGLSVVANGFPWQAGDEVVCYQDDYPANVYPWMDQQRKGVKLVLLEPEKPGDITLELVERALTSKTKMVALASAHFLTGTRIDIPAIGKMLREKGIYFCVDGIQTVGAFDTPVEYVDFLSSDAHKWMLGPMAAGILYVREELQDLLRPSLLGAWNVRSPNFITQDEVQFESGGRRYEPGVLNAVGIYGMRAAMDLILEVGVQEISEHLLRLKARLIPQLEAQGFEVAGIREGAMASGITTLTRKSGAPLDKVFEHLTSLGTVVSFRHDREGIGRLRFSPHLYNTEAEIDRVCAQIEEVA